VTAAVILFSLLAGFIYRQVTGTSYIIPPDLTVYAATFMAGLFTAAALAFLSRDRRCVWGAIALVAHWAASYALYKTDAGLFPGAALDAAVAAYFIVAGRERWEIAIGLLFLASASLGFLAYWGIVPTERAGGFVAFSIMDLTSLLGNVASAVLGFASGDSGKRVRSVLRSPSAMRRRAAAAGYRIDDAAD
jgi:hypothetical protein